MVPRFRLILCALGAAAFASLASLDAHGTFEKKLWAGKRNQSTRGSAPGTSASKLYFMQAPEFSTGRKQTVGWRVTLQDADAATAESVRLAYVKFAADGKSPDTSANGELIAVTAQLFGRGLSGNLGYRFLVSIGVPQPLPATHGMSIELPANAKWPQDGVSVHAQLNLPNDLNRPRVLPPHDKETWCFERSGTQTQALGKRSLDTLDFGGIFIEPVITPFIDTYAYDDTATRPERVTGADALFPVAQRGDAFGLYVDGGQVGTDGFAILYASTKLAAKPIALVNGEFSLSLVAPDPYFIAMVGLDTLGSATVGPLDFLKFPKDFRQFWMQALILNPFSFEVEATDAIKIRGQ